MELKLFSEPQYAGSCCGIPVYRYGYTDILGAPPDLTDGDIFQENNNSEREKITLKRSRELKANYLGSTLPRMPRSEDNDYLVLECGNLIDGNDQTCWCSNPSFRPDVENAWIRIDLPIERTVNKVVLSKRIGNVKRRECGWLVNKGAAEIGKGMPRHLTIKVSTDACCWTTVFDGDSGDSPDREVFEFCFDDVRAKQIWIIGSELPSVENLLYCFSISRAGVFDERGREVSLAKYGSAVSVSSSMHTMSQTRECHHWHWGLQYELGFKWGRIGYHDDPVNWHWVEREKGVLSVDPEADYAIDHMLDNGVEVVMSLDFGNRLYTDSPERLLPQLPEWNYEMPKPPTSEEAIAAWKRYVEFMVKKYAGRIRIFEGWNEWNADCYWGADPDCALFVRLSEIIIEAVKKYAPDARLMMGSVAGFPYGIADWTQEQIDAYMPLQAVKELGRKVDYVGWHPFYQLPPDSEKFMNYERDVAALKRVCADYGFSGQHIISEYSYNASCPQPKPPHYWEGFYISELQKAKIVAQLTVKHNELDMPIFFCETWNTSFPADLSLTRRLFGGYPLVPTQPEPAFYVLRNLSNILENCEGCPTDKVIVGVSEPALAVACLSDGVSDYVALWQRGTPSDECTGIKASLTLAKEYADACAIDPINGTVQKLVTDGRTVDKLSVPDYPMIIRLS